MLLSDVKDIQFVDRIDNCYPQMSQPMLEFLKELGHPRKDEDIDSIEVYSKTTFLHTIGSPKLYFETILNLNKPFHPSFDGKKIVRRFKSAKTINPIKPFVSRKYIKVENIEKARLTILFRNSKNGGKSRIEILMEIGQKERNNEIRINETDHNDTYIISEILNLIPSEYIFQRNLLKKQPFKFGKFSSSSIHLGAFLALTSCLLCGLSFVFKKKSLLKLDKERSYYEDKGWWMAHLLMIIGDILHFIAFFFAPAVLVCTLQMLMVVVVAAASSYILNEKINTYWKLAFALSLAGCFVIIVHVPKESHIYSINAFLYMITAPAFLVYISVLLLITVIMMKHCIPRWSKVNSLAYTVQSAIFGSIIVIGVKGILLAFTDRFFHWLPIACFSIVGVLLLLQLNYLNRALSYYNTLVVTTQYYVLYSALVIMASSILYEVWQSSSDETLLVIFFGFATIVIGVLIFAIFQEDDATFDFSRLFAGPDRNNKTR